MASFQICIVTFLAVILLHYPTSIHSQQQQQQQRQQQQQQQQQQQRQQAAIARNIQRKGQVVNEQATSLARPQVARASIARGAEGIPEMRAKLAANPAPHPVDPRSKASPIIGVQSRIADTRNIHQPAARSSPPGQQSGPNRTPGNAVATGRSTVTDDTEMYPDAEMYPDMERGFSPPLVGGPEQGMSVEHGNGMMQEPERAIQDHTPAVHLSPPPMRPIRVPLTFSNSVNGGRMNARNGTTGVGLNYKKKDVPGGRKASQQITLKSKNPSTVNPVIRTYTDSISMMSKQLLQYRDEASKYSSRITNIDDRINAYHAYAKKMDIKLKESKRETIRALQKTNRDIRALATQITTLLKSPKFHEMKDLKKREMATQNDIHRFEKELKETDNHLKKENKRSDITRLRETRGMIMKALTKSYRDADILRKRVDSDMRSSEVRKVHILRKRKLDRIKAAQRYGRRLRYLNSHLKDTNKRDRIPGGGANKMNSGDDIFTVQGRNIKTLLGKREVYGKQLKEYESRMKALGTHIRDYKRTMKDAIKFWAGKKH